MKKLIFGFLSLIFLPTALWAGDFSAIGAPMCGYGQYRIGNTCYEYGAQNDTLCDSDSVSGAACLAAFVESSGEFENLSPFAGGYTDIGAPTDTESPADAVCGGAGVSGAACLAAFVESSGEFANMSPFSGGFTDVGAPSTAFENMKAKDCLGTMDGYYITGVDWYSPMVKATCPSGTENYVIPNDCQYIDMANTDASDIHSPLNPENWMCGVLCDTGALYTGTGACSMPCTTDGIKRRLHIKNETYEFSVPLYSDKLTTPAMNFSIYDTSE
ncbi:MAG: hypothetical protein R8N24_01295, partial [Alphaproteobacteria bacterium]|nr:hypothetical protein [Alphaproteobacteria bacterium]